MINVTELRAGAVFEENGVPWVVVKYEHMKVGRGTASIKIKAKNLKTGSTIDKSYINGARVQDVLLEKRQGQFLYDEGDHLVFMEPTTFDQFNISKDFVGDAVNFLKEGTVVDLKFFNNDAISIVLPLKMRFKVVETDPGVRGNTVSNVFKDAKIDTGAKIKVPLFVNEGEEVVVNTDTGEYVERANKN